MRCGGDRAERIVDGRWLARRDLARVYKGEKLGALAAVVQELRAVELGVYCMPWA